MTEILNRLYAEKGKLKPTFSWLVKISAPYKKQLSALLLVNLAVTALSVASAALNKQIVDFASNTLAITVYSAIAVLFGVLSVAASVFLNLFSVRVTEKHSCGIRSEIFSHILKSAWKSRTSFHSENFLSRITSDASVVSTGITTVAPEIVTVLFNLVAAFFLLLHYDKTMALTAALTAPVAAVASLLPAVKLKKLRIEIQKSEAEYRKFLQEGISNADIINVLGCENESIKKLNRLQDKRFRLIKKQNRYSVYAGAAISVVFSGTYLFTFIRGAILAGAGLVTFGTITAYLTLIGQIQGPVLSLAKLLPQCIGIAACAERIMEISDMPNEKHTNADLKGMTAAVGVRAEGLSVSYSDKNILSNLSFDIAPGQTVMISGGSGIGKTTLLRTILGFLEPSDGKIYFYTTDEKRVKCSADTRKLISYVPQGNTLFSGTIAENLKMAKPDATKSEMEAALKAACAWEFVTEMPDGINTQIGEKSAGISEGQAQRISIARAFLKPFEILVLDEATSALDEKTEREILSNLRKFLGSKTCVFVSHRKTVAEFADGILDLTLASKPEKEQKPQ